MRRAWRRVRPRAPYSGQPGAARLSQSSHCKPWPVTSIRCIGSVRKFPTASQNAKKPGIPGFLLVIRKDHSAVSNSMGEAFVMSMFTHRSAGVTTRAAIDELGRLVLTRGGW